MEEFGSTCQWMFDPIMPLMSPSRLEHYQAGLLHIRTSPSLISS